MAYRKKKPYYKKMAGATMGLVTGSASLSLGSHTLGKIGGVSAVHGQEALGKVSGYMPIMGRVSGVGMALDALSDVEYFGKRKKKI